MNNQDQPNVPQTQIVPVQQELVAAPQQAIMPLAQQFPAQAIPTNYKEMIGNYRFKDSISKALPATMSADRFVSRMKAAAIKTPKLNQCTVVSVSQCMLDLAGLGLEPDGRLVHLIPYKDTCTLIIDYKGLVALALRSPSISSIRADIVCENDDFEVNMSCVTKHVINYKEDRGAPYLAWACCTKSDGTQAEFSVMTYVEIEKIRQASQGRNGTPWSKHYNEMAKKTVIRRLCKLLPIDPAVQAKLDNLDALEFNTKKIISLPS